jgi:ribosome-associated protein
MSEWLKERGCKPRGYAYAGSNPAPPIADVAQLVEHLHGKEGVRGSSPLVGFPVLMDDVEIRGDTIRLGQLLKLSGIAGSGAEAKALLLEQGVTVNGEPEARRGRQLHRGDVVAVGDEIVRVA